MSTCTHTELLIIVLGEQNIQNQLDVAQKNKKFCTREFQLLSVKTAMNFHTELLFPS